jgi:L-fuconolactonase
MVIDAHQHFWRYEPAAYPWITAELAPLQRDFLPADLAPLLRENGVTGCIAVEARAADEENEFLLELANQYAFIKGVVGWLDLRTDGLAEKLDHYAQASLLKGFRYNVQVEPDPNFLLRPDWLAGMKVLAGYSFTFDLLIFPHQLGAALELAQRFPEQRFVIDHLAKPYVKDGFFAGWAVLIAKLGELPNVWCKVSGLVTEADWDNWTYADLEPYLSHLFASFPAKRLMFGSDWPVCRLAGRYGRVKGVVERFLATRPAEDQRWVWGQTASDFYQLNV